MFHLQKKHNKRNNKSSRAEIVYSNPCLAVKSIDNISDGCIHSLLTPEKYQRIKDVKLNHYFTNRRLACLHIIASSPGSQEGQKAKLVIERLVFTTLCTCTSKKITVVLYVMIMGKLKFSVHTSYSTCFLSNNKSSGYQFRYHHRVPSHSCRVTGDEASLHIMKVLTEMVHM